MTSPSLRDMEILSAYLDGNISPSGRTRLEARLRAEPDLAVALKGLRQTRELLRRTPQRRAPRNFTLTAKMAGIRPPVPRLVPAFSWASAVAMVLFIFTLGTSLVSRLASPAAEPMLASAPVGVGGGGPAAAATAPPAEIAPAPLAPATEAPALENPVDQSGLATPTPETYALMVPEATQAAPLRTTQPPPAQKAGPEPFNFWLVVWPALAVLLGLLAFVLRWVNQQSFKRKNPPK
jgi:hypothetical protein